MCVTSNVVPHLLNALQILKDQFKTKSDVVTFLEGAEIGGRVWTIRRDPDSGEYYNSWSSDSVRGAVVLGDPFKPLW